MFRKKSETQSVVFSAFVGFALGFVASMLLAPKSGEELRKRFWDLVDEAEMNMDEELEERGIS